MLISRLCQEFSAGVSNELCKRVDAGIERRGTPTKQIPEELLDQLLEGYEEPEDLLESEGSLANP